VAFLDKKNRQLRELAAKIASTVSVELGSKWIPHLPHPRQQLFLSLKDEREALFGGSVGGGKSIALLMAALEYVDVPGYSALLLRRNTPGLSKPGGLLETAHEWLNGKALWNEQKKQWKFPSGATITFGFLEKENDKYRYYGDEYQFIGFDELTQFTLTQYLFLFSRLRKTTDMNVPLRMRAATNPGSSGNNWVAERFIPEGFSPLDAEKMVIVWKEGVDSEGRPFRRPFVPSRLKDNPSLDSEDYMIGLQELDLVTRERLLNGEWRITERGDIYPMWDEDYHVITWSQFAGVYGSKHIPSHWLRAILMDNGTTEGHPNVTSWFATSPQNSIYPGSVFLYRGHCVYAKTTREIAEHIITVSRFERDKVMVWRNGHEGNSERLAYNKDFGLPFQTWKADRNGGIAQVSNYLEIRFKDEPHPFKPEFKGRPMFYLIVDDEQEITPRNDLGLARWREEFPSYHYQPTQSGVVQPYPLFNDAMDTVRAAGACYFAPIAPLNEEERVRQKMAQVYAGTTFETILDRPAELRGPAIDAWRLKESEVRTQLKNRLITSNIVKWRKRGRHV